VRKLKSVMGIVRRLGMRVNRQHNDVNRAVEVRSLFRFEEY
jgi:hypothetical protein